MSSKTAYWAPMAAATLALLVSIPSVAGPRDSGGGDSCESRIQEIRDDILNWIQKGGPRGFQGLPVSVAEYSSRMGEYLATIREPSGAITPTTQIECVHRPIAVQGIEKVCRFDRLTQGPKITCNAEAFMDSRMSADDQYRLVHHEYAGLANLEVPSNSQSSYIYSNQITDYLEQQLVLKLAVKSDPSKHLDLEKIREGMKFALEKLSAYDCTAKGEGLTYGKFYYIDELDKMTSVQRGYWDLRKDSFFEYIFSYVDNNDVKYEERIITTDESVPYSLSLNISRKQKVNKGTIDDPQFVMDYVSVGKINCPLTAK